MKKIVEYEIVRLFAMICVVAGHSCYTHIGYAKYQLYCAGGGDNSEPMDDTKLSGWVCVLVSYATLFLAGRSRLLQFVGTQRLFAGADICSKKNASIVAAIPFLWCAFHDSCEVSDELVGAKRDILRYR